MIIQRKRYSNNHERIPQHRVKHAAKMTDTDFRVWVISTTAEKGSSANTMHSPLQQELLQQEGRKEAAEKKRFTLWDGKYFEAENCVVKYIRIAILHASTERYY